MSSFAEYRAARRRKDLARQKKLDLARQKHEAMLLAWKKEEELFLKNGIEVKQKTLTKEENKRERYVLLNTINEEIFISTESISQKKPNKKSSSDVNLIKKINNILDKLSTYDSDLYKQKETTFKRIKKTSKQKIAFFYDSLKLDYGKAKSDYIWTRTYKRSIEDLYSQLKQSNLEKELTNDIEKFLESTFIDEDRYNIMFDRLQTLIENHKDRKKIAESLTNALKTLDYTILNDIDEIKNRLINKKKVTLSTSSDEYKIVIALNKDNTILTRFVRIVEDPKEIGNATEAQKIIDQENVKKWCNSQIILQEKFKNLGLDMNLNIIEDENSDILYIIDRKKEMNQKQYEINKEVKHNG